MTDLGQELRGHLREIPDFPKPGITFIDITPLLRDPRSLGRAVDALADWAGALSFDVIVSPEARGFILGAPLAVRMGKGFIPVRKPGKLPSEVERGRYHLEYGEAELEIHKDAVQRGVRAIIVDDLLATGGTARAASDLVEALGGTVVAAGFLVELTPLRGRLRLGNVPVFAAVPMETA